MNFTNANELLELCDSTNLTISEAMWQREVAFFGKTREETFAKMTESYNVMKESVRISLTKTNKSMGGLIGGEAQKINKRILGNNTLCGSLFSKAVAYSAGVLEVNSSMNRIVAAPTAGASGVLPGTLLALQEERGFSDDTIVQALFNAGAVGYIIMHNATVSGAEAGCQAEVGAASAMTASAVTELFGGAPQMCLSAASSAMSNLLGLVCDPIGGLVEVPCQQRNSMGAANALACAEFALSGIINPIPFDEIVGAMYLVGRGLPHELRETGLGGVAGTPTGCGLCMKGI